jgi:pSer/pThr/pTyr-binding forkhead associated (FHA) protein
VGEETYCTDCGGVVTGNVPTGAEPAPRTPHVLVYLPGRIVRQQGLLGTVVRVGRSEKCDVAVDHPRVSRHHCTLELHDGVWWVSDARSSGGTFLNDRPIHDPVQLHGGDTIRLGRNEDDSPKIVFRE